MSADVTSILGADYNFLNVYTCIEGGWAPVNQFQPCLLWNTTSIYSVEYLRTAAVYRKEAEQRPSDNSE